MGGGPHSPGCRVDTGSRAGPLLRAGSASGGGPEAGALVAGGAPPRGPGGARGLARAKRRVAEGSPRQASRVGRRRPFGIALPHLGASGRPEEPGGGRAPHRREALVPGPCRVWGGGGHRGAAPSSPGRRAAAPGSAPSGRTDPVSGLRPGAPGLLVHRGRNRARTHRRQSSLERAAV